MAITIEEAIKEVVNYRVYTPVAQSGEQGTKGYKVVLKKKVASDSFLLSSGITWQLISSQVWA